MTTQEARTIIVRTRLPEELNRALDHVSVDTGRSKSALLVEAVRNLLGHHGRGADVAKSGGGR